MKRWILIFLLIASPVYAQPFMGGFHNFGSDQANGTFTATDNFGGKGPLGASDVTVQQALETLDSNGGTLILAYETSDDFCFTYTPTTLSLFMSSNQVHDWTIVTADEFLLLESGDFLLLEDGVSKLVLE